MTFHITHRYGDMERDPPISSLALLLAELEDRPEDIEHTDVSLTHESEWCMSVGRTGTVTLENLESGGARHMVGVPEAKVLALWALLARGDLEVVMTEPWKLGYK
jgi:hypothetical protein